MPVSDCPIPQRFCHPSSSPWFWCSLSWVHKQKWIYILLLLVQKVFNETLCPHISTGWSVCQSVHLQLCQTAQNHSKWSKDKVVADWSTTDTYICLPGLILTFSMIKQNWYDYFKILQQLGRIWIKKSLVFIINGAWACSYKCFGGEISAGMIF